MNEKSHPTVLETIFGNDVSYFGEGPILNNTLSIRVKKLYENSNLPTLGSKFAAGWDLYAWLPEGQDQIIIYPHTTEKVSTGLAMAIPNGWEGEIRPRSGLATKKSLANINSPGTIDSDYRGEVFVALHNYSMEPRAINRGDRIAQILFHPVPKVQWIEADSLSDTERGEGGFGSSGY